MSRRWPCRRLTALRPPAPSRSVHRPIVWAVWVPARIVRRTIEQILADQSVREGPNSRVHSGHLILIQRSVPDPYFRNSSVEIAVTIPAANTDRRSRVRGEDRPRALPWSLVRQSPSSRSPGRAGGLFWRAVYAACVPETVNGNSRQLAQARLRAAVRARMRRTSLRRSCVVTELPGLTWN